MTLSLTRETRAHERVVELIAAERGGQLLSSNGATNWWMADIDDRFRAASALAHCDLLHLVCDQRLRSEVGREVGAIKRLERRQAAWDRAHPQGYCGAPHRCEFCQARLRKAREAAS